jgi:hypothetical protein
MACQIRSALDICQRCNGDEVEVRHSASYEIALSRVALLRQQLGGARYVIQAGEAVTYILSSRILLTI